MGVKPLGHHQGVELLQKLAVGSSASRCNGSEVVCALGHVLVLVHHGSFNLLEGEGVVEEADAEDGVVDDDGEGEEDAGEHGGEEPVEQGQDADGEGGEEGAVHPLQTLALIVGEVVVHALFVVMVTTAEVEDVIGHLDEVEEGQQQEAHPFGVGEVGGEEEEADEDGQEDEEELAHEASPGEELHVDEGGEGEGEKEGLQESDDDDDHRMEQGGVGHGAHEGLHEECGEVEEVSTSHHATCHAVPPQSSPVGHDDEEEAQTETQDESRQGV